MNNPETTTENKAHAEIGIVSALPMELAPLREKCSTLKKYTGGTFTFRGGHYDNIRIAFVESGLGYARARNATLSLIEAHTPNWIISCGFSGALLPEMKIGDIVVANGIVDMHGQSILLPVNMSTEGKSTLHVGKILTSDEMIRTVTEKQQLAEKHSVIAVDMESLAVAQVCQEQKKNFMVIRVISDDLSQDLPPEILTILSSTGGMRLGAALGSIWKRPSSIKEMWKLRENATFAAERLAIFLDGVIKQLGGVVSEE